MSLRNKILPVLILMLSPSAFASNGFTCANDPKGLSQLMKNLTVILRSANDVPSFSILSGDDVNNPDFTFVSKSAIRVAYDSQTGGAELIMEGNVDQDASNPLNVGTTDTVEVFFAKPLNNGAAYAGRVSLNGRAANSLICTMDK